MLKKLLIEEFLKRHKDAGVIRETLKGLPEGRLRPVLRKGRTYYYHCHNVNGQYTEDYVPIKEAPFLLTQLLKADALHAKLEPLEEELHYLRRFLTIMHAEPDKILSEDAASTLARSMEMSDRIQNKQQAMKDSHGNRKTLTHNGEYVRSKSEAIIANLLAQNGISYQYEKEIFLENQKLLPDFTIETAYDTIFWEHCGMMNDPKYRDHWNYKRQLYWKYGIREGKNLIVTYDEDDGGIDSMVIQRMIDVHLK